MRRSPRFRFAILALLLGLGTSGCASSMTSPVGVSVRGPALAVGLGSPCASASLDVAPIPQVASRARFAVSNLIKAMQAKAFGSSVGTGVVSPAPLILSSCQY